MLLQSEDLARSVIAASIKKGSAKDASLAVIKSKIMEAMAAYIASVFMSVPFPINLGLAAGANLAVGKLVDTALSSAAKITLPSFAGGGDFVTHGPQLIVVGDNPSGRERVSITPSESIPGGMQGGGDIIINIQAPMVDQSVIDYIAPAIVRARELGKIGVMVSSIDAH